MQIVPEILEKVEAAGAQIVAVTKYIPPNQVVVAWEFVKKHPCVLGIGENRAPRLTEIGLPRDELQFIGHIQSRQIPAIAIGAAAVHSLCDVRHAEIFARQPMPPAVWVQVNISGEPKKSGVESGALGEFLKSIEPLELDVRGLSAIGVGEFTLSEKIAEFRHLRQLRDDYLPGKKISAGTSRDFEVALGEGIEVVRIGTALWQKA